MSSSLNSSNIPNTERNGGKYEKPLVMINPMNLIVMLTFYSPIIIAICVVSMSFIFQNFKGLIYLGFLLGVCVLREFILLFSGIEKDVNDNRICDVVQYSNFSNSGFSMFALSFTILYICVPMFLNNDINFLVLGGLIFYLLLDISIRYSNECVKTFSDIFLNLLTGALLGVFIPSMMYLGGSSKYLFFNEISSSKEVCSMAKKQKFKCAVYKNGELVNSL